MSTPTFFGQNQTGGGGGGGGTPAVVGQALLYTGNGSAGHAITGADFSPDLAILRKRTGSLTGTQWRCIDNVRGADKLLSTSTASSETTDAAVLTSFDANGVTLGASGIANESGSDFLLLLLQRVAGAFDIVTYTGTGVAHAESHGLGAVVEMMFIKNRSTTSRDWQGYAASLGNTVGIALNGSGTPVTSSAFWNNTDPTSAVFTVGTHSTVNTNGNEYVAILFASLNPGVKVGSYTGDGATNGPVITTGFRPKIVIIKRTDAAGHWTLFDDQRDPTSPHNTYSHPALGGTATEQICTNSAGGVDFLSTGFQSIDSDGTDCAINVNTANYIYLAIA